MELDLKNEKVIIEKDGKSIECEILFTFDSEDTLKSYVGYTDNTIGSNERKNIYVSAYNPLSNKLENVTDEKELEMIQDVLNKLDTEANS